MEALRTTALLEVVEPQLGVVLRERRMELIMASARLRMVRQASMLLRQDQGHRLTELDLPHTAIHSLLEHRPGADQVQRASQHLHLVEPMTLLLQQRTPTPNPHLLRVQVAHLWTTRIRIRLQLGLLQLPRPMLSMLLHLLRRTVFRNLQSPQIRYHWRGTGLMRQHLGLLLRLMLRHHTLVGDMMHRHRLSAEVVVLDMRRTAMTIRSSRGGLLLADGRPTVYECIWPGKVLLEGRS